MTAGMARTEDEQLAAVRLLLRLETGADIVGPLHDLLKEKQELRNLLEVIRSVTELTIRNLRKQILDIQVLLENA